MFNHPQPKHQTATNSSPVASTSQLHTLEVANPSQTTSIDMATSALGNAGLGNTNLCIPINDHIQSARPLLTQTQLVSASTKITAAIPIKVKYLILEGRYIDLALLLPDRRE
ncbi:hypothetical protein ACJMK2_027049 [Sinanodonta woodiana]|uniref:Uncharacterized protein n=1 Tax=Sinanodonta woodiana TaxID=1069815 RepID=A0ABD3XQ03_SINWO